MCIYVAPKVILLLMPFILGWFLAALANPLVRFFEEKMRLGNQGFWKTIANILNAVVTEPEDFNAEDLTLFDFQCLMYKMRTVSYGHIYKVRVTCPVCGKETICRVDLDSLEINYLDDDFTEPYDIGPLPRSKDTLQCRLPRISDVINTERRTTEILKKSPEYQGDPAYILNMAYQIVGINGERYSSKEIEMYVEKMSAMDSAYFQQVAGSKITGVGMNTECHDVCESCGEELVFALPFNSEFFRPTYDI